MCIALAGSAGVGCAAEVEEDTNVQATIALGASPSIFGGTVDAEETPALRSVVALRVRRTSRTELCSGTLVAGNVVLTARHCVANALTTSVACDAEGRSASGRHVDGDLDPERITVFTGSAAKLDAEPDAVARAIVSPEGDSLCDRDIALVVLDRPIEGASPLPVRLGSGVATGETIRSVGYGVNDLEMPLGTRLTRDNVAVLAMGKGISESRTPLGPHEFEVGRSICQGDSGGPAISEETGAIVGVVSRGGDCTDDFGHIYTTTAGWAELFSDAFTIAGGAPLVEPERSFEPPSPPAPAASVEDAPRAADACSTTPGPVRSGASAFVLFACAVGLCVRRERGRKA